MALDSLFLPNKPVSGALQPDRIVRTVCSPNCYGTCGVNAFVKDNRILKIEPATYPDPGFERICVKGIAMATERIKHAKRLTHPLIRAGKRGENKWRQVSWDEAYEYIIERLQNVTKRYGPQANSWLGMTGNYGIRAISSKARAANCLDGTLFSNLGLMSDLAGLTGAVPILGAFLASNEFSHIVNSKYMLFAGRNAADTGHCEMQFVFDALENGSRLLVIDPRFSRTAAKADQWFPIKPGSDVILVMSMIHSIIEAGLIDSAYVARHTNAPFLIDKATGLLLRERDLHEGGSDAYQVWDTDKGAAVAADMCAEPVLHGERLLRAADGQNIIAETCFDALCRIWMQYPPEKAEALCGVGAEDIRREALRYAQADPAWIFVSQGIQRYSGGHSAYRAYITLAALCGNIGKRNAGVSWLDGPFLRMYMELGDEWIAPTGRPTRNLPGMKMLDAVVEDDPYPIRSLWLDNYGFATQSPLFKRFVGEALPKLDLFVVNEQLMTDTAIWADVVLPVVSYYEDDWDLVAGGEIWYMQLRQRAIPPIGESRNDYQIYKGLCDRLGLGEFWQMSLRETARHILQTHKNPSINAVDWETLCRDGVARVPRRHFAKGTMPEQVRAGLSPLFSTTEDEDIPFGDMRFNTPSGRIELYQEQFIDIGEAVLDYLPPSEGNSSNLHKRYPLNLITYKIVHSAHSQHTVLPGILELLPEPTLEICAKDAKIRSITDGSMVSVFNDRGSFRVRARVMESVGPGTVAMSQGWWKSAFKDGHPSDLANMKGSLYQERVFGESNYPAFDLAVEVRLVD